MSTVSPEQAKPGAEVLRPFLPTPERVSQFLELKHAEVEAQLKSVQGREALFDQLLQHEDDLRTLDPTFDPEEFRASIDLVGQTLTEKEALLEESKVPEKRGMFLSAFDRVKGFAINHPVVTVLLALAGIAGAAAGAFALAADWEAVMAGVGAEKVMGGAEAARELLPITPATPPLPDGGTFSIPGAGSPPGMDTAL